jgi:hypothetical protein
MIHQNNFADHAAMRILRSTAFTGSLMIRR